MTTFTEIEIRDIIISILLVSVIFWVYLFDFPSFIGFFSSLVIVFFSFFLHEMGHKFAARRLGCIATYKIWPIGVLIGLVSIVFGAIGAGIVFIAVGAVEIMPYSFGRWGFKVVRLGQREMGLISLAGVGLNVFFAVFFKLFPGMIFQKLSYFNGLFAIFNLIPFPPLDGAKIFMWKEWLWLFMVFVSVLSVLSSIGII
jgi:Zn-dependent protease